MTDLTKAEVLAKCTAAQIASHDQAAMAATINIGRVRTDPVSVDTVKAYLHQHALWVGIQLVSIKGFAVADPTTLTNTQKAAMALVAFAESGVGFMHMDLPVIGMQLSLLVAGGLMTEADKTAILALAVTPDPVTSFQVAQALEGA